MAPDDANGNPLTIEEPSGDVTTNTWNGENRLVQVEHPGGDITTYTYNADGLRVREEHAGVETRFVYDGNNLLRETDDTNLPEADYTYIPQAYAEAISQRRDGDSSFYLADGIKNVRKLTDDAGLVADDYAFDAFGGARSSTGSTTNSQQYKGQLLGYRRDPHAGPDTDYSTHHRNYNPKTGRFRSEDPAADDLNLYRYVNNDPVNREDPSGLLDPQKLKESLATYDPLALEWLEERGVDLVAYTPTSWESVWGWEPSVKVGEEVDPVRYQVRLDANRSNWSAFLEVTQRVRMQEGYQEWKAAWMARNGIPDKREQILQPAPGSPEAVTFWRTIAKQDHQNLIRMMREIGATEDEITAEEWRPFYHELSRPGGSFEQIIAAARAARAARVALGGSGVRNPGITIEPPPRPRIVATAPQDPPKVSGNSASPKAGADVAPRSTKVASSVPRPKQLDEIAQFRSDLGLPAVTTDAGNPTVAKLEIGGKEFFGTNSGTGIGSPKETQKFIADLAHAQGHAQPTFQSLRHAEADTFIQAFNSGTTTQSKTATLYVDKDLCDFCRLPGGLDNMLRTLKMDSVTVITPGNPTGFKITASTR